MGVVPIDLSFLMEPFFWGAALLIIVTGMAASVDKARSGTGAMMVFASGAGFAAYLSHVGLLPIWVLWTVLGISVIPASVLVGRLFVGGAAS